MIVLFRMLVLLWCWLFVSFSCKIHYIIVV